MTTTPPLTSTPTALDMGVKHYSMTLYPSTPDTTLVTMVTCTPEAGPQRPLLAFMDTIEVYPELPNPV